MQGTTNYTVPFLRTIKSRRCSTRSGRLFAAVMTKTHHAPDVAGAQATPFMFPIFGENAVICNV